MKRTLFLIVIGLISSIGVYAQDIPNSPSDAYVDCQTNILMLKKPLDNSYQQFVIKGVNWSPATRAPEEDLIGSEMGITCPPCFKMVDFGFFFDWYGREPQGHELLNYWLIKELSNHYSVDIPLIKDVNANTVRLYNIRTGVDYTYEILTILDECYKNNIMVIVTVAVSKEDLDSGLYSVSALSQKYLDKVDRLKNHPAVLMWVLGNEWNFNKFYDSNLSLEDAAKAVNQAAKYIKAIDPHHPVCSVLGDKFSDFPTILANCPDIDIWGVNIYRGSSFGSFFDQWEEQWLNLDKPVKPVFISEFGIDSFYTENCTTDVSSGLIRADNVTGYDDQQKQADVDLGLWQEIKNNLSTTNTDTANTIGKLCLGGLIFEFNDELWKVGSYHVGLGGLVNYYTEPDSHSYDDYNNEGIILSEGVDNTKPISEDIYTILNEEHCGLVTADRVPKQAYTQIKEAWETLSPEAPIVIDEGDYTFIPCRTQSLTFWFTKPEGTEELQYKITEGSIDGPTTYGEDWEKMPSFTPWVWDDPSDLVDGKARFYVLHRLVDGKTYYCSIKAINEAGETIGYSDGITCIKDETKPTGSIQITKVLPDTPCSSKAELLLNAVDYIGRGETAASGMGEGAQMSFSFDGSTWQAPQPYCTSLTLALMPGAENLYVQFRDAAGNWSIAYSVKIPYPGTPDKTPPQITHTPIKSTPKYRNIVFTANVTDSESGIEGVTLYWNKRILRIWGWTWSELRKVSLTSGGNNSYQATLYSNQTGDRKIKYYISAKDKAGNVKKTNTYTISR